MRITKKDIEYTECDRERFEWAIMSAINSSAGVGPTVLKVTSTIREEATPDNHEFYLGWCRLQAELMKLSNTRYMHIVTDDSGIILFSEIVEPHTVIDAQEAHAEMEYYRFG